MVLLFLLLSLLLCCVSERLRRRRRRSKRRKCEVQRSRERRARLLLYLFIRCFTFNWTWSVKHWEGTHIAAAMTAAATVDDDDDDIVFTLTAADHRIKILSFIFVHFCLPLTCRSAGISLALIYVMWADRICSDRTERTMVLIAVLLCVS